jgi:hypothetical protein
MIKYSALKEMYYGNRGQYDTVIIEKADLKILDTIVECDDMLRDKLKERPELLEIYNKFDDALSELNSIENENFYIEGFKFGFLMAIDVFNFNKD